MTFAVLARYLAAAVAGSSIDELLLRGVRCQNPGMAGKGDYCAFTKAVEHLGDRWSLVIIIIRELTLHGTRGFNALAGGMPGISRSVLAARLRKLEDLELIARDRSSGGAVPGYRLTYAGRELQPILQGLWGWSLRFVPEDPAMAERDPDIVIRWLCDRIDPSSVPDRTAVVELAVTGTGAQRFWLVLEHGTAASICIEDPCLAADRYVFVEADVRALYPIARGMRDWSAAVADGTVRLYGEPGLISALPSWFVRDRAGHPDGGLEVGWRPGGLRRQTGRLPPDTERNQRSVASRP
jgi:DNA-binding HxlR family transcriptional regulator